MCVHVYKSLDLVLVLVLVLEEHTYHEPLPNRCRAVLTTFTRNLGGKAYGAGIYGAEKLLQKLLQYLLTLL